MAEKSGDEIMPYKTIKIKCKKADGTSGSHVVYKKKRDGSAGDRVGCTSDPEAYKKALYAAEDGAIEEKKDDRCTRIAKRKYDVWPSAYASGAVVKCRQGKIWKDLKEEEMFEQWDQIDEIIITEEDFDPDTIEEGKFDLEKKYGLRGWFMRNKGKGWVDCKTGKPCGRQKGEKRKGYPACRPTMAQCKAAGKGPLKKKKGKKKISWKKGKKKK
tara:strand:+ start:12 stop:653 length:642 start_codon:yes stop_codon:yes gene_type:complete